MLAWCLVIIEGQQNTGTTDHSPFPRLLTEIIII